MARCNWHDLEFLSERGCPKCLSTSPTGSTAFLIERDAWKNRALAAESKLDRYEKALRRIAVSNSAVEMVGVAINAVREPPK